MGNMRRTTSETLVQNWMLCCDSENFIWKIQRWEDGRWLIITRSIAFVGALNSLVFYNSLRNSVGMPFGNRHSKHWALHTDSFDSNEVWTRKDSRNDLLSYKNVHEMKLANVFRQEGIDRDWLDTKFGNWESLFRIFHMLYVVGCTLKLQCNLLIWY